MHTILFTLKTPLFFSFSGVAVLINRLVTTQRRLSVAQASPSFKHLGTCTPTPTFIKLKI